MTVLQPGRHAATSALRQRRPVPGEAVGHLAIDTSHSPWCPWLASRRVAVTVDDLPLHLRWGRTHIALPPGRHHVEIAVDRGDGWGHVVEAVPVAAGHTVDVYYRAPVLPGRPGALGPVPQQTPGMIALLVLAAVLLVVVVLGAVALLA